MVPKRKPQAILRVIGSKCSPRDGIGTAWSQSEAHSDDTDKILALSGSSRVLCKRISNLFSCKPLSFWSLQYELVKILISVGSIKTALDYALKLHLWEEVISCYQLLDLR